MLKIKLGVTSCPECKEEVHKDANICPHCRTQLSEHPVWLERKANSGGGEGCLVILGAAGIATGVLATAVAGYMG